MNDPKKPTDAETDSTATTEADGEVNDQDLKQVAGGIQAEFNRPPPKGDGSDSSSKIG